METSNKISTAPKENKFFMGWLAIFLLITGLRGGMLLLMCGFILTSESYSINVFSLVSSFVSVWNIIYFLGVAAFTTYTIIAFSNKRSNAVFLGKSTVIFLFLSYCLISLGMGQDSKGLSFFVEALLELIIWFAYLFRSQQVADWFPKKDRRVLKRDKYMVVALTIIAVSLIIMIVNSRLCF